MPPNLLAPITETSCLVNITHEILVSRWKRGKPCIAVCPSQYLEKIVAFDAALHNFDKILALQFKAYKRNRGKSLDYFSIHKEQHKTLWGYPVSCAFYVFPNYRTHQEMDQDRRLELAGSPYRLLKNTWFVEVHSVSKNASRVYGSDLDTSKIPSLNWLFLEKRLDGCQAGFRVATIREHRILYDPEERVVEVLEVPSGRFALLYV